MMKAKLVFQNLGTLADFLQANARKVRFGTTQNEKTLFEMTMEADGVGFVILPKDTKGTTPQEAEALFLKVTEQAKQAAGFVRCEITNGEPKTTGNTDHSQSEQAGGCLRCEMMNQPTSTRKEYPTGEE